ncbi:MAG: hypothetical protein JXB03_11785 [Spirochaetales bacterium]|nr:hypothetical protein [Spirochaetales bacterium]
MKKGIFQTIYSCSFALVFCAAPLVALPDTGVTDTERSSIVVWPAEGEGVPVYALRVSTKLFEKYAADTGFLSVVSHGELAEAAAMMYPVTDLFSIDFHDALKYGRDTGILYACHVVLEFNNSLYQIHANLYDIPRGTLLHSVTTTAWTFGDLDAVIEQAMMELVLPEAPAWYLAALESEKDQTGEPQEDPDDDTFSRPAPVQVLCGVSRFLASAAYGGAGFLLYTRSAVLYRSWLRDETNYEAVVKGVQDQFSYNTGGNGVTTVNDILGYSLSGLALGLSSVDVWAAAPELTAKGRFAYGAALSADAASFVSARLALDLYIQAERAYDRYLAAAQTNLDGLYRDYTDYLNQSKIFALTGLGLAAASGVVKASVIRDPGDQTDPLVRSTTGKILMSAGDCFLAGAMVWGGLTNELIKEKERAFIEYERADAASITRAADKLDDLSRRYDMARIGLYTMAAAGAGLKIAGLFIPENKATGQNDDAEADPQPMVRITPVPSGIIVRLAF